MKVRTLKVKRSWGCMGDEERIGGGHMETYYPLIQLKKTKIKNESLEADALQG